MTSESIRPFGRGRWIRLLLVVVGLLVGVAIGGSAAIYWLFLRNLPDPRTIADYRPPLASTVFDREGRPIGEFFSERRRLVAFEEVPEHVIDAFVSAEDASFFEHEGIDFPSIARAAWKNLLAGGKVEGASTITQQMVKGLLLTPERTYTRKIREMILARRIEQRFTKQEILYLYLNQIYFGHGAYGLGEAARSYFAKPVSELTVSEAAQLAGLPKAPSRYSPFAHPEQAERRRRYVLDRMLEDGAIDASAHGREIAARPVFVDGLKDDDFAAAAYFTEEVRRFLFDALGGETVLQGGLRIETTLDIELQRAALAAVQRGLEALDHRRGYRGPLRRVERAGIEAEIARVAQENGLAVAAADAGDSEAPADEAAEPPPLTAVAAGSLEGRKLVGVVVAVDGEGGRARVALGPDLDGEVALADAAWAAPQGKGRIEKLFAVGDVARFTVLESEAEPDDDGAKKGDRKEEAKEEKGSPAPERPLRLALHQEPLVEGALFSLEVGSGDIVALVGGYDFTRSQFNRATQSRRQPGSAFKPLVYATALSLSDESGRPRYTPASIVHDRPKVYTDRYTGMVWKPKNYEREFYGPITLRRALAKSVNNATIQLCDEVGIGTVIRFARRLGIRSPLEPSLATALGTNGVSLLEITRAYAVFANGGRRVVPRFLVRVLDRDGNVLLENVPLGDPPIGDAAPAAANVTTPETIEEPPPLESADASADDLVPAAELPEPPADPDQLIPPEQAYLVTDMLRAVVLEGTGSAARSLGRPVAGKTGTTNDQADAWFVGFSPDIATGVWVGHDEVKFLGSGETGAHAALPVWTDYMRVALEDRPPRDFPVPDNDKIVWARIDRDTGLLASPQSTKTVFQSFIAGTEPTETAASAIETDRARQDLREDSFEDVEDGFGDGGAAQMPFDPF